MEPNVPEALTLIKELEALIKDGARQADLEDWAAMVRHALEGIPPPN